MILELSDGEAITLRVALISFMQDLQRDGLGDDELGKTICEGYILNTSNIFRRLVSRSDETGAEQEKKA